MHCITTSAIYGEDMQFTRFINSSINSYKGGLQQESMRTLPTKFKSSYTVNRVLSSIIATRISNISNVLKILWSVMV